MNARLQKTQNGVNDGSHAPGVPRVQATMGAEWDPACAPGLTLQGYGTRRSKQYVNMENEGAIAAWTRVDLGARYMTKRAGKEATLRFAVDNVFNKRYRATVAPQFGQLTAGNGRNVKAICIAVFLDLCRCMHHGPVAYDSNGVRGGESDHEKFIAI